MPPEERAISVYRSWGAHETAATIVNSFAAAIREAEDAAREAGRREALEWAANLLEAACKNRHPYAMDDSRATLTHYAACIRAGQPFTVPPPGWVPPTWEEVCAAIRRHGQTFYGGHDGSVPTAGG